MRIKSKAQFYIFIAFIMLIFINVLVILSISHNSTNSSIVIPSVAEIKENGYPQNEFGETYGVDIEDSQIDEPDLILVENKDGLIGYIRKTDLNGVDPKSPDDAASFNLEGFPISMYLQDGRTVIGTFYVGKKENKNEKSY